MPQIFTISDFSITPTTQ